MLKRALAFGEGVEEGMRINKKLIKKNKWMIPLVILNILLSPVILLILWIVSLTKRGREWMINSLGPFMGIEP